MSEFKKQFRGYSVQQVDSKIDDYQAELASLKQQVASLTDELDHVKEQNSLLQHRVNITEKTNEEIARLALKEASELIEKAKRNANMILKESMEYVRGLSKDMDNFKQEAIDFRANVVKMSEDMLETIDKSEIFSLIREEKEN